jgi:stress response protein YsnF
MKTIVALYDDFPTAQAAIRDLVDAGFPRENISLMASDAKGEYGDYARTGETGDVSTSGMAAGAGIGAAVGGLGGLLVGLGALAIPGVGPVLAAGPLAAALAGAGIGAVAGGLIGALTDIGVPEEQAGLYAEAVRRGGTLVTATVADSDADQAVDILERHNPVDVDRRAGYWRESGWTGYDANAEPYAADRITEERELYRSRELGEGEEARIPVVEEDVKVGKRAVERGRVRIHSRVEERPVEESVNLREEQVRVERRPVDRPAQPGELSGAFTEGTIEVTERGEEPVVSKETRVVEEVVVGKEARERQETVRDKVRRTDVEVEETEGKPRR